MDKLSRPCFDLRPRDTSYSGDLQLCSVGDCLVYVGDTGELTFPQITLRALPWCWLLRGVMTPWSLALGNHRKFAKKFNCSSVTQMGPAAVWEKKMLVVKILWHCPFRAALAKNLGILSSYKVLKYDIYCSCLVFKSVAKNKWSKKWNVRWTLQICTFFMYKQRMLPGSLCKFSK